MSFEKKNLSLAIVWIFASVISNALIAMIVKMGQSAGATSEGFVFWRYFLSVFFILPWLTFVGKGQPLKQKIETKHIWLQFMRWFTGALSLFFYFFSLHYLSLSDSTLLFFTNPLFLPLIAYFWKGEKISLKILAAILLGFIGVILIIKPGHELFHITSLIALLSGLAWSISIYATRLLHATDSIAKIIFYSAVFGTVIAGLGTLIDFEGNWVKLTLTALIYLIILGIVGTLNQFFWITAVKYAPPVIITPFLYFTIVITMFLDWYMWGTVIAPLSIIGALLIVAALVLKIRFHAKL